jgi:hypothetical protein
VPQYQKDNRPWFPYTMNPPSTPTSNSPGSGAPLGLSGFSVCACTKLECIFESHFRAQSRAHPRRHKRGGSGQVAGVRSRRRQEALDMCGLARLYRGSADCVVAKEPMQRTCSCAQGSSPGKEGLGMRHMVGRSFRAQSQALTVDFLNSSAQFLRIEDANAHQRQKTLGLWRI